MQTDNGIELSVSTNGTNTVRTIPAENESDPLAVVFYNPRHMCPFLGQGGDAKTSFAYPTPRNLCYQVTPATTVKAQKQQAYCLTEQHVHCPLYQQSSAVGLPSKKGAFLMGLRELFSSSSTNTDSAGSSRGPSLEQLIILLIGGIGFLVILLVLLAGWRNREILVGLVPTRPTVMPTSTEILATPTEALAAALADTVTPTSSPIPATATLTDTPTATPNPTLTSTPTPTASRTPSPIPTMTASNTPTPSATPTDTPIPPTATNTPTNTATPVLCGPPAGWIRYTVQSGDTLFNLSQRLGVTIAQLQFANCLGNSTRILVGQRLWVPFTPPPRATNTPLPATATDTPTATATAHMTNTPVPTETQPPPTATIPPTATSTPEPYP